MRVFVFQPWSKMRRVLSLAIFTLGVLTAHADTPAPQVVIETTFGPITIEAYPEKAPESAGDFLRYVDEGLYSDAGFYRVVRFDNDNGTPKIEVVQGGLPADFTALPPVTHETTDQTGLKHIDGAVSLARADVGTGSAAAIFISVGDHPSLDYGGMRNPDGQGFAVFGQVIEGMDVIRQILAITATIDAGDPYFEDQLLAEPIRFERVYRLDHSPETDSASD